MNRYCRFDIKDQDLKCTLRLILDDLVVEDVANDDVIISDNSGDNSARKVVVRVDYLSFDVSLLQRLFCMFRKQHIHSDYTLLPGYSLLLLQEWRYLFSLNWR